METIYHKKLAVVNRYPVYNADIKPLGVQFIELDGFVDETSVQRVNQLLKKPEEVQKMVETNFHLGKECFSFEVLEEKLKEILNNF